MSRFLSKDTNVFVTLLVLTCPLVQSQNVFMKYYWRSNSYRATGWIGTGEVKRDTGLQWGETQRQNVSPGSSRASRFNPSVPIHPGSTVVSYQYLKGHLPNVGNAK